MMRRTLTTLLLGLLCTGAPAQTPDTPLTVAMCGDIMMGTTYPTVRLPQNDGADIFADVAALFREADLAAGNLEGVICEGGTCTKNTGKANNYAFRMPESYAHLLTDAGFDYLNLANNHTNDFGAYGLTRTRQILDEQGIAYSGLPDCESTVVVRDSVRYGICSFGHNSYTLKHTDTATVSRILAELRPKCDILIVSFHGGAEGSKQSHLPDGTEYFLGENRGNLRAFAHHCVDMGADVVFGHGPHVTRAVELYNDRIIAYSLGNFCTTFGVNLAGVNGYAPVLVVRIDREGRFLGGRIHSFIQTQGTGPKLDAADKVAQHIRTLSLTDFRGDCGLNISDNGTLTRKTK